MESWDIQLGKISIAVVKRIYELLPFFSPINIYKYVRLGGNQASVQRDEN